MLVRLFALSGLVAAGWVLSREIVCRDFGRGGLCRGRSEGEAVMRYDLGPGLLGDSRGASEVVGVGVGDDHGVDVTDLHADLLQPLLEGSPSRGTREAWVDDCCTLVVDERVAVDVFEAREVDR